MSPDWRNATPYINYSPPHEQMYLGKFLESRFPDFWQKRSRYNISSAKIHFKKKSNGLVHKIVKLAIYRSHHGNQPTISSSTSSPHVLSHISVSLARLVPRFLWSSTGILVPWASMPLTYRWWADFSLLPALKHSSMNALIPSRMRVPG